MEETERERLEAMLEAVTLAGSADLVRQEIHEFRRLADVAAFRGSHAMVRREDRWR